MIQDIEKTALRKLVKEAGSATMRYFRGKNQNTQWKADLSPITEADKISNALICSFLKSKFPSIPLISEEEENSPYKKRKEWDLYWLVDPLDGTKEFIAGIPEFTVNVALIQNRIPILGFVGVPPTGEVYVGELGKGAYVEGAAGDKKKIKVRMADPKAPTFIISRSNGSEETRSIKKTYPKSELLQVGSSLKFLKIAEGSADIYFRHEGIGEWDTASGHAVLLAAGGKVLDHLGKEIVYGSEDLRVRPFVALGDKSLQWEKIKLPAQLA